ncbi:MAG TPA: phage tail protein [Syntrophorhabdaceae bacterium]|nr:phage tail protein [Syntrophorhabdaceae bacterium]
MEFDMKLEGVEQALKLFDPNLVRRAANTAINDAAKEGITGAEREIQTEYNINKSKLSQFLKLTVKAKGYDVEATITGKGRGLALSYFDAKQVGVMIRNLKIGAEKFKTVMTKNGRRFGGDVTALVKLASGRKIVQGKYGNKPFIAQMKTGHIGVWVRQGKERKPIEQLFGPGVGGLFGTKKVMDRTISIINEKFGSRFAYWFNRYNGDAR